jgi:hypothetical protein
MLDLMNSNNGTELAAEDARDLGAGIPKAEHVVENVARWIV